MLRHFVIVTLLCSSLFACQHSPRKHHFVLTAPADSSAQLAATNTSMLVGIGPIVVADYLDRSHIVYSENDNTLAVLDNDYWAEPLDKGVTRVIGLNLTQLNQNRSVVNFPWRGDSKPSYSVRVNINNLTRTNGQASINATWELVDNVSKTNVIRKTFSQSLSIGSGTKALVQGYSKLLAELSQEVDAELNKVR